MKILELNRFVFFLKLMVQSAVMLYLIVDAENTSLKLWLGVVLILVFVSNMKQMKLQDEAIWSRVC